MMMSNVTNLSDFQLNRQTNKMVQSIRNLGKRCEEFEFDKTNPESFLFLSEAARISELIDLKYPSDVVVKRLKDLVEMFDI